MPRIRRASPVGGSLLESLSCLLIRKRCSTALGGSGRRWRVPMPGHELVDAGLRPAVHELGQEIGEVARRVHTIELAGFDQGRWCRRDLC
jgi:hypothetical protein